MHSKLELWNEDKNFTFLMLLYSTIWKIITALIYINFSSLLVVILKEFINKICYFFCSVVDKN